VRNSPVISRRLRPVYFAIGLLTLFLIANSAYLWTVTSVEFWTGAALQSWFYYVMFLLHIVVGVFFAAAMAVFIGWHYRLSFRFPNPAARQLGIGLGIVLTVLTVTGILLVRLVGIAELNHPQARQVTYWIHVVMPFVAVWMFWLHRVAGRRINWKKAGQFWGATAAVFAGFLAAHQIQSPRPKTVPLAATQVKLDEEDKQFGPSLAKSATGDHIAPDVLMNDKFCVECHPDVHARWSDSVHKFSSFNNPAYLASISETKDVLLTRDGHTEAMNWCAGCHDPVPLFSGRLADPNFDMVRDETAQAGITCTVCHAISYVNSTEGNGDYTLHEPEQYPFTDSSFATLRWISRQLIKAKPALHKQTYLKPFHKTAEFCSTCHKVSLPKELNHYKDFLRGQNHYDSYLLSGVSGHGSRSFYYPPVAQQNCNGCHMPAQTSNDVAARQLEPDGPLAVHDHLFPAANTAIAWLRNDEETIRAHREFLENTVRVDLFGLREGHQVDGKLHAPLRPTIPVVVPGEDYLLEVVVRTLTLGHHLTQGTTDSNELWLEVEVQHENNVIVHSGALSEDGTVDPESHFINAFVIDRHGNRIARRNTQDIFTKVYDHQIPPGAGQSVHYALNLPPDLTGEIQLRARVLYRKFDSEYMEFVAEHARKIGKPLREDNGEGPYRNQLPITVMAQDTLTLPLGNAEEAASAETPEVPSPYPLWQRWNDYGIGAFLKGKGELRQAEQAFLEVEKLGYTDGPVNLARVYFREGRLDEAGEALQRAIEQTSEQSKPNPWTVNYLAGIISREQGELDEAEAAFRSVLSDVTAETQRRGFDFSRDYLVRADLGSVLFDQSRRLKAQGDRDDAQIALEQARDEFLKVLEEDSEHLQAHYNLSQIYRALGDEKLSGHHQQLHQRYLPDYNAQDRAVRLAREKYPLADLAADPVTIYPLRAPTESD